MNDYRAAGQELQSQVLAAARKGQERVNSTVKTMPAAADQIRPQLANLPKPPLLLAAQPPAARARAELVTKLLPAAELQSRLPNPEQLRPLRRSWPGTPGQSGASLARSPVSPRRWRSRPPALAQIGEPAGKQDDRQSPAPRAKSTGEESSGRQHRQQSRASPGDARPRLAPQPRPVSKATSASDAKEATLEACRP